MIEAKHIPNKNESSLSFLDAIRAGKKAWESELKASTILLFTRQTLILPLFLNTNL